MKILGDRVLLSPLPVQKISAGGIHLPQGQAGDVMYFWRVEQIGTLKPNKNGLLTLPDFEVGDTVITPLHFTHTTLEDGSGRKIVDFDQLIGKLEREPTVPDV